MILLAFDKEYVHEDDRPFKKISISPERIFFYPKAIFYLNDSNTLSPAPFTGWDSSLVFMLYQKVAINDALRKMQRYRLLYKCYIYLLYLKQI